MRPVPPGRLAVCSVCLCTLCRMLDIYPCCVQAGTIWTRASTAFRWAGTRWGARSEVCQVSTHENKFKYIYSISCNFLWFPLKYIISIQGFTGVVEKFRHFRNHFRYYLFIEIQWYIHIGRNHHFHGVVNLVRLHFKDVRIHLAVELWGWKERL